MSGQDEGPWAGVAGAGDGEPGGGGGGVSSGQGEPSHFGHYCKKLTPPFIPFISYVSDCKVSQELKEMKETVTSVQASLITSVSLIQGRYHYLLCGLSRLQTQY